jgi:hypothetical protein
VGRAVPAVNDRIFVPQGDVAVEVIPRRGVKRRVSNTGICGDSKHLLDRRAGFVPKFHAIRKVLSLAST